jgi:putative transposase
MVDREDKTLSIRGQCKLLGVHRSSVYYTASPREGDTVLANELHEVWQEMPFYGYRRLTVALQRKGYDVNTKRVRRLMKDMWIEALYPKPRTTVQASGVQKYPYLLKERVIKAPDEVWATDITYIKLPGGFAYLVALIDVYSRYIVAWRLSNTMEASFCLEMLEAGLRRGKPLILNTDQGSQFTGSAWVGMVEQAGVLVSQDGKGRWVDNVYIERFWRTLKHEHLRFIRPETLAELRQEISRFITMYNNKRLHQALGYKTPTEVYHHRPPPCGAGNNLSPTASGLFPAPQGQLQPNVFN